MAERDYQHRDIIDKLGIKPGHAVAFATEAQEIELTLRQRISQRTGRPPATDDETVDVVLALIDTTSDAIEVLQHWKSRLKPTGSIWLLTPKRDQPGYVNQNTLIAAGPHAGVVDNKVCSVSLTTSALRFVIRKRDRAG